MIDAGQGLGRDKRLRKRSGFLLAQRCGRRLSGQTLVVYAMRRTDAATDHASRLGITVSKKVGNAIVRNRIKRWVRESYRRGTKVQDTDIVVIAKPAAAQNTYQGTATELSKLLGRLQPT